MKVFCGGILTETNSFSPIAVGLKAFEESDYFPGGPLPEDEFPLLAMNRYAQQQAKPMGWKVEHGLVAFAQPGAPVQQQAYETLRDRLLDQLRAAMPVDVVALNLHGAMIAHGYEDCEGDLLSRVRDLTGPDCIIGAELDPHCHLSEAMLKHAAVLVCYRENPHTDVAERAEDLIDLLYGTARHRINPCMSVYDCRMADVFQTDREPMKAFVAKMKQMENTVENLLSISVVHGFRRSDIPDMGAKVIVITDNDPALGEQLAEELGRELFAMRGRAAAPLFTLEQAVEQAMATPQGPVVLADVADNPGGGAPGDSTFILQALIEKGETNIAIGYLWDGVGVRLAMDAGIGATYMARIGGKICPLSGPPLDLEVTVTAILAGATQRLGETEFAKCNAARLTSGDLDVVLIDTRMQTFSPSIFEDLDVDLTTKKTIIVKSAQHYRMGFAPFMLRDIVVGAPGVCVADITTLPFTRIKRPMWPFDKNPFVDK